MTVSIRPDLPVSEITGLSILAQMVFDQADLSEIWNRRMAQATAEPADPGALLDLAMMLELNGQAENAMAVQAQALGLSRVYRRRFGDGSGLRVLVLVAPGGFMANTPVDFLMAGSDAVLDFVYVTADAPMPAELPDHDVAFLAVGESTANAPILAALAPVIAGWPRPMVNDAPAKIMGLTRDGVCAACADMTAVLAPATVRVSRKDMEVLAALAEVGGGLPAASYPLLVRPLDSHAGQALEKIDDGAALGPYLAGVPGTSDLYVTSYVDYAGEDGLFRKQRVAVIGGVPFASHLAVSNHWMVHYLSAGMAESPERRAEEAAFMAHFDEDFAVRHAQAFAALTAAFGLDYYAIDCAETADGRLLLFEADVAMIIHAMDSETLYPYKRPAMKKLFAAFQDLLARAARSPAVVAA